MRFVLPSKIKLPVELSFFLCEDRENPDAEYEIKLIEKPICLQEPPVASYNGMKIYRDGDKWLRVYSSLAAEDGCRVVCMMNRDQKNLLYYPASKWSYYAEEFHCLHLIGIEELLLQKEALLLHSSVVQIHGYAVLFSGPSGIGKSTQAALWEKHLGAEVLNGDRCIIRKKENTFYGCGSPWCGTSLIYRKEQAPLKGIFILQQSGENKVSEMGSDAFVKVFGQCIVNAWNREFVIKLMDLLTELLKQIPVYKLSCRPDEEAVQMAYDVLFEGGI